MVDLDIAQDRGWYERDRKVLGRSPADAGVAQQGIKGVDSAFGRREGPETDRGRTWGLGSRRATGRRNNFWWSVGGALGVKSREML